MSNSYTTDWKTLRTFCQQLMMKEGMSEEDALICAENLVDADLCGVESHGVSRITNYMKRLRTGVVDPKGKYFIEQERSGSIAMNGGNAMGMVVAKATMAKCMEKAKESGCCFATASHSNHFGMASTYVEMAARAGMIGICATNAPPNLAPWGSSQKYMGTNPIAFGAPTLNEPIVLDMAPSVVAMGKIILAAKLGKTIPEGWVLAPDGKPTTDPVIGQNGTLIPIGGAKGSGIAIFMEILCGILGGAGFGPHLNDFWKDFTNPQNIGHFFIALDISAFGDTKVFLERITQMVNEMKALPKNDGVSQIFMPGEIEISRRAERKVSGIHLSESVYKELMALSETYNVKFDYTEKN